MSRAFKQTLWHAPVEYRHRSGHGCDVPPAGGQRILEALEDVGLATPAGSQPFSKLPARRRDPTRAPVKIAKT
jgi:hypothetical protein